MKSEPTYASIATMLHYPEVLEMSSFCPPSKSAARKAPVCKVEVEDEKILESLGEESDADADANEGGSSNSTQGSQPKERRRGRGGWPRLEDSEAALIRFLSRHHITVSAISTHKECLWAHSTVTRHASKKNMAGKDEKYITADFYRILAELQGRSKGKGHRAGNTKKAVTKYAAKSPSPSPPRTRASGKKQAASVTPARPQASSSAHREDQLTHTKPTPLALFLKDAGIPEYHDAVKAAGVTDVEKLRRIKNISKAEVEEIIPGMKPIDRHLFLAALAKL
ncbi:hypothetical protein C8R46DRAFT_1322272 [Mycena filopes]|nr:hypothetical protein C8R46DRAFT_1322272 [Mycena filopes]